MVMSRSGFRASPSHARGPLDRQQSYDPSILNQYVVRPQERSKEEGSDKKPSERRFKKRFSRNDSFGQLGGPSQKSCTNLRNLNTENDLEPGENVKKFHLRQESMGNLFEFGKRCSPKKRISTRIKHSIRDSDFDSADAGGIVFLVN